MYRQLIRVLQSRSTSNRPLRFPIGRPGDPTLTMLPPRVETVPTQMIMGSVNRYDQLDRRFLPTGKVGFRFRAICKAMAAGVIFPPIELYRLHGACYVIDGHHRVGAARVVGQMYLDAVVIDCLEQNEPSADPLEAARARFMLHTGLQALAFSAPAGYDQALEQIFEHRWYLCERESAVSTREAAGAWYRDVYRPVVLQVATEHSSLDADSAEAADLYLYLSDLKYMASKAQGHDVGFTRTVEAWISRHGRKRGTILRRLARPFNI